MKKNVVLLVLFFIISVFGYAQNFENLDYVSPLHDGLIAIKKDTNWGFINKEGNMVINFINDLVTTKSDEGEYPVFKNGRCSCKRGLYTLFNPNAIRDQYDFPLKKTAWFGELDLLIIV